ncbi:MAG: aspartate aminotransferase family protein [Deltaproteobacteria bacterium HGW-Deltaproteobacteria-22]|nr:MAG: aspartate aminotransferase family protein [Deltaproteobacteria bacterium HGW-Deltaproteobacteria-22]
MESKDGFQEEGFVMSQTQKDYLDRAAKVLARIDNSYAYFPENETPVFNRGEGIYLYDPDGVEYLDMVAGYGTVNQGHTHPHIVQALLKQANLLAHTSATLSNVKVELAEKLAELSPIPETMVHFDLGGARATEGAKVLVRAYTGKPKVISFSNAFHGRSAGSLSMYNADQFQFLYNIQKDYYTAPYPYCRRCPFGKTCDSCSWECLGKVQDILRENRDVGGIIVEPALGARGYIFPPMDFFKRLRRICDEHGVLLISDEIQMGMGRLGAMFACELYDTVPDIILLAKSLGGTMWPLSAILGRRAIMQSVRPGTLGSTFAGAPLACGVGLASLEVFEMENLCEKSQTLGKYFLDSLRERASGFPLIVHIEGRGLAIGIEFELPNGDPATAEVERLHHMALRKRLLLQRGGPAKNMINMIPALTITREQIDEVVDRFVELLNDLLLEPKVVENMAASSAAVPPRTEEIIAKI